MKWFKWLVFVGLSCYIFLTVAIGARVYRDTKSRADAIIILGAKSKKGDAYNPCLVARVRHGVDLYNQGYASHIIVTGGDDAEDKTNEASTMKQIAVDLGVPMEAITLEPRATSTYENFLYSKKIMDQQQWYAALIVTEPFHMPRAALVARRVGIPSFVSPAVDSPCWTRWKFGSRYFLKEPLALIAYWLTGKAAIPASLTVH